MILDRSSGVLMHISSLPSPYGIGDMGPQAYQFVDFLQKSGFKYWQLLPLTPTHSHFAYSPYSSFSAFAGNYLFISPEKLQNQGYIDLQDFDLNMNISSQKADFGFAEIYKNEFLKAAFLKFKSEKIQKKEFSAFCKRNKHWLNDYALFMALRSKYGYNWTTWPEKLQNRKTSELKIEAKLEAETIEYEKFIQFVFYDQWEQLIEYAHGKGIKFIGDIPFYVNHDSVECWANPEYFKFNSDKQPEKVSGVPPDYFSEDGQLWGTPVYDWKVLRKLKYDWWIKRLRQNLILYDVIRLDHFRAFSAYWEIPAQDKTAVNGKWVKVPGTDFFKQVKKEFPDMPWIAEDLGLMDQYVYDLIENFNFPVMKVLQFAFGDDRVKNPYLPFNHIPNSVVYTGTHDNNTTLGWFNRLGKTDKKHFQDYIGTRINKKNATKILIELTLSSVSKIAILPMQDILNLGEEAIMNRPGTMKGNWSWRLREIPMKLTQKLWEQNVTYGRFIPEISVSENDKV